VAAICTTILGDRTDTGFSESLKSICLNS